MVDYVPPVEQPKVKQMNAEVQAVSTGNYADDHYCKSKEEAENYVTDHGGLAIPYFDGRFKVIFIPKK